MLIQIYVLVSMHSEITSKYVCVNGVSYNFFLITENFFKNDC